MTVTVFGATGATGKELVRLALAAGHEVIALVRHPEALPMNDPKLDVLTGDVTNAADARRAIVGSDAVLSALGSREMSRPTTIYSAAAAATVSAMRETGVRRVIAISAIPVIPAEQKQLVNRYVLDPLLHVFFGGGYDDMGRLETALRASDRDWTVFRPPYLTNGAARGHYRTAIDAALPGAFSLARADLAAAMLAAIDEPALIRHAVTIAY